MSEFERLFPKPSDNCHPLVMGVWKSQKEGYLAGLKKALEKADPTSTDYYSDIMEWIKQEIKAVEKENK